METEPDITPDADRERLLERLDRLPEDLQPRLRMGFRKLSALDANKRTQLANEVLLRMGEGYSPHLGEIAIAMGVDRTEVGDAIVAATLLFGLLFDLNMATKEFLDITESKLFSESDRVVVSELVGFANQNKTVLKNSVTEGAIARSVLPSFSRFEVELDVRIKFDGDKFERSVPVAVAFIDTDSENQRLWFQLQRSDMRRIISRLQEVERQMDLAQNLNLGRPK